MSNESRKALSDRKRAEVIALARAARLSPLTLEQRRANAYRNVK